MDTFIFKTNINSNDDFLEIKKILSGKKKIKECTIDLLDKDKVLRVLSDSYTISEIESEIGRMGFYCKELEG